MVKLLLALSLIFSFGCSTASYSYKGNDGENYINYECFKVQGPLSSGTYKEDEMSRLQVEQKDTTSLYQYGQEMRQYSDPYNHIPPHFECRKVIKGSYRLDGNEK